MNQKIFAAIALFAACIIVLGQVQLTNLDQKSFTVDIAAPVTNIVNLNLRRSQFSPSTSGWVLTNISGVFGGSTNISTNSIWGIDGFGNITPIVTNNAVIATNIVRYGVGRMFGTESWLSKAITLTNGPNYLGAAENSQFFLIGPTTNPADCQIILSNAVATGQKLVLVNQTNAIPAEGAWTMTNNTPIPDGAGVVKLLGGYDLISTNGYISYFEFISPDWQEVGRILASGASGLLTNVFNNIVVYSNITLRGNASLTINNITLTTNDIWHTNIVAGVTNLQPVNLNLPVVISNTLSFQGNSGTNFLSASGNNLTWKSLSSTPQIVLNDGSTSTTYAPAGITDAGTSGAFQLYVNGSGGGATAIQLQGVGATHFLTPVTADVQLGYSGTSFLWEGSAISTRNRPSQWWGYSSGTGSADFELSHTGTNGVVLLNSVAINDAGVPKAFSFASNGVQIARINMNSGYTGTGTNVFLDNGTFGAVPGGGGGTNIWFDFLPIIDSTNGTTYGSFLTNKNTGKIISVAVNNFTNGPNSWWGAPGESLSLATPNTDVMGIASAGNFDYFDVGDQAGSGQTLIGVGGVFNIGESTGVNQYLSGVGDVNNYGLHAGDGQIYDSLLAQGGNIFNFGPYAGTNQKVTNSFQIFNFGADAGQSEVVIDSGTSEFMAVMNYGKSAGQFLYETNCINLYNFGTGAGQYSQWTNCSHNINFGRFANSSNVFDGKSFMFALGDFSTTTNSWDFSFGCPTNNYKFPGATARFAGIPTAEVGLSSLATDAAVAITTTGITNNLGKLAFAYLQGTNLVFTIKDSSNTPYFTNSVAIGIQALPVQAGGAITISSGTASGVLKAL